MAEATGVPLKTEQRRSHTAVAGFGPWVRRAEGYRETRQIKPSGQVPVTLRRPPSLPLVCEGFPDPSSFSVLRGTPMAFSWDNFKQLKCYRTQSYKGTQAQRDKGTKQNGFSALCLCHYVPLSLNLSVELRIDREKRFLLYFLLISRIS